jgi:hypothetical protein
VGEFSVGLQKNQRLQVHPRRFQFRGDDSTKYWPRTLRSDSNDDSDADVYAAGAASVLFMFPPASYVEGTSLTTSLRYQDSRLEIS